MNEITTTGDWYKDLIFDIQALEFNGIVVTKHAIGKRILLDFEKFGKPEYGGKRVENIAKDLKSSRGEIYRCIQFAEKYTELSHAMRQLSWYEIANELLPKRTDRGMVEIPRLPDNKYNIIYADPPWEYYIGGYKNQSQHYDNIPADEVPKLKDKYGKEIKDLAADDCILFLWSTWPISDQIYDVIDGWGFQYSSVGFVWVKSLKDGTGFFFGNGNWTRANTEFCLIGRKGTIRRQDASISQIIYEPIREHSRKPDCVRDKIVQLVGALPRIELFARQKAEGWDRWGNEQPV